MLAILRRIAGGARAEVHRPPTLKRGASPLAEFRLPDHLALAVHGRPAEPRTDGGTLPQDHAADLQQELLLRRGSLARVSVK